MAKATAKCICKHCGKEFEKTKQCYNRREADSWKEWAEAWIDVCPDCQKKAEAEKLMQGEVVEMKYAEYKNKYADKKTVPNSYNPETKTILVVVKTSEELKKEKEQMEKCASVTKSQIMKAAHTLAKSMRKANTEMAYRECLSAALKQCYAKIREAKEYLAKF